MAAPILKSLVSQIQNTLRTNQRGYITEKEMNGLLDGAQQSLQNLLIGLQQPQAGSRYPLITDEVTSDVKELLRPFIIKINGVASGSNWTFPQSTPILKVDNYITGTGQRVRTPNDGRINSFLESKIRMPSTTNYVGEWVSSTEFSVTPQPLSIYLIGLNPVPATNVVYGAEYTIDEALSTELLWSYRAVQYLLYYALKQYGISVNSPFLVQISAQLQSASV